jgi:hypothetical protein
MDVSSYVFIHQIYEKKISKERKKYKLLFVTFKKYHRLPIKTPNFPHKLPKVAYKRDFLFMFPSNEKKLDDLGKEFVF